VDERNGRATRTRAGGIVEDAESLGLDRRKGLGTIVDPVTDMMNAGTTAVGEPLCDSRIIAGGSEKLNVAFGDLEKGLFDAIALDNLAVIDDCAEGLAVVVDGGTEIRYGNGDVIDLGEKGFRVGG
jgi:hypothetical protein